MFKHIILPIDGSELSLRAVKLGVELAGTCGGRVFVLHVIAPFHTVSYMAEMLAATEMSYADEAVAHANRYLDEARKVASDAGVPCDSSYVFNDHPYEAIVQTATEQHGDLIVMASHGWRGMTRLLLGSETHKVLLKSDIPVLVCH